MKERITNPFITGGYVSPDYFCDRQNETNSLLNAINSRRNVTLISLRRMGKTGLLKHIKYILDHTPVSDIKKKAVIYVDLMPTMNSNDLLNSISTALLHLKHGESGFMKKLLSLLSGLRPKISIDTLTGQPTMELKVETPVDIKAGLDSIINLIGDLQQEIVFIFDEFQQVTKYPEKNIEQMLRSVIQSHPSIPFIFSGSSSHMLEQMFSSASRPFYQSAELMYLDKITENEYLKFITRKLRTGGMETDNTVISEIFRWTRLHTFYVQYVCNLLFETNYKVIDFDAVNQVFYKILISQEPLFSNYRNIIPAQQFKLLQAIAIEDGVTQPTSGSFINSHKLTSASSVTTSLKSLSEKEMIVQNGNQWVVYDVFFSRWLEYQYKR